MGRELDGPAMVFIKDEGSQFDASLDMGWKYPMGGSDHDEAHTTVRNAQYKPISETPFTYSGERNVNGHWSPESMRFTIPRRAEAP
jgi:hypothetical protein